MFHYEEVPLEEMQLQGEVLRYPCPCGDVFELLYADFLAGKNVARCPTCSLTVMVICSSSQREKMMAAHAVVRATV